MDQEKLLQQVVSSFVAASDAEECSLTRDALVIDRFTPIIAVPSCGLYAPISYHNLELVDLKNPQRASNSGATSRRRDFFSNSTLLQKVLRIDRRRNDLRGEETSKPANFMSIEGSIFVVSVSLTSRTCRNMIEALSLMNSQLSIECKIPHGLDCGNTSCEPTPGTFSDWSLTLAKYAESLSTTVASTLSTFFSQPKPTKSTPDVSADTSSPSGSIIVNPASPRRRPSSPSGSPRRDSGPMLSPRRPSSPPQFSTVLKPANLEVVPTWQKELPVKEPPPWTPPNIAEGFTNRRGEVFKPPDLSHWSGLHHVQRPDSRENGRALKSSARTPRSLAGSTPPVQRRKKKWVLFDSERWFKPPFKPDGMAVSNEPRSHRCVETSHDDSRNILPALSSARSFDSLKPTDEGLCLTTRDVRSSSHRRLMGHRRNKSDQQSTNDKPRQLTPRQVTPRQLTPVSEEEYDQAFFLLISLASLFSHAHTQGSLCNVAELVISGECEPSPERGCLERLLAVWLCNYTDSAHLSFPCLISQSEITARMKATLLQMAETRAMTEGSESTGVNTQVSRSRRTRRRDMPLIIDTHDTHPPVGKKFMVIIPPIPLARGTHIYREIRSAGGLSMMTHHGLYVGGGEVIHFSGNEFALRALLFPDHKTTKLRRISIMTFMKFGGRLIVEKYTVPQETDDTGTHTLDLTSTTYHRSGIFLPSIGHTTGDKSSWYSQALSNEGAALRAEFAYCYFHWARHRDETSVPDNNDVLSGFFDRANFVFPPYNLFSNNCEHFCRWCKTGAGISLQVNFIGRALEAFYRGFTSDASQSGTLII
eukprot:Blabericola_migrator_1__728@NODE_1181_length_5200_cov_79_295928_g803_i0_p1_GENE_NODE_1181_length_5200_cov_79_295928_g803_i0NODE_1181_length_5200_cov_79_295928_g803_i0_p1_ORF_typecomplete_len817_score140_63LRAT/PF04970_13/3_6e15Peptidase_C97/PF05903_14/0_3_NODE_1181_length_5200_cov_79_295928_g803_i0842534